MYTNQSFFTSTRKKKFEEEKAKKFTGDNIPDYKQTELHDEDQKTDPKKSSDFQEPLAVLDAQLCYPETLEPDIRQDVIPIDDPKLEPLILDDEIKRFETIIKANSLFLERGNSVLDQVAIARCYYSQKAHLDKNIDNTLAYSLKCCSDYIENPSFANRMSVESTAKNLPNKSSVCKKLFGAMLALAGVTLVAAATLAVVFSWGTSAVPSFLVAKLGVGLIGLGAGVIGSSSIGGGAYLFHNGCKKHSLSKEIIGISDLAIPSR